MPARRRGQRNFDFLKVSTDNGLVGWSEYNDSFGGKGVTSALKHLAPTIMGRDPRAYEVVVALRRQASGGMVQRAIGAIENALLDIKAKALGIPVYQLFGGPVRERIQLYWSHCATYRLAWPEPTQIPPLRTLDDTATLSCKFSPPNRSPRGCGNAPKKLPRRQRLRGCV